MRRKISATRRQIKQLRKKSQSDNESHDHEMVLKQILMMALAFYIVSTCRRPVSKVVEELMDVEIKAAELAGHLIQRHGRNMKLRHVRGALAGAFSFIHFQNSQFRNLQLPEQSKRQRRLKRKVYRKKERKQ